MEEEQQDQTLVVHEPQATPSFAQELEAAMLPNTAPSSPVAEAQEPLIMSESREHRGKANMEPSMIPENLIDFPAWDGAKNTSSTTPDFSAVDKLIKDFKSATFGAPVVQQPSTSLPSTRLDREQSNVIDEIIDLIDLDRSRPNSTASLGELSPPKSGLLPSWEKKQQEEERTIRYAASIHPDLERRAIQEITANSSRYKEACMIVLEREHGDGHGHTKCEVIMFARGGECLIRQDCVVCRDLVDLYQGYRLQCEDVICQPCLFKLFENAISTEALHPPNCGGQEITLEWFFMNRLDNTDAGRDLMIRYRDKREEYLTVNRTYCAKPACSTFIKPKTIMLSKYLQCEVCLLFTCTKCKNLSDSPECCVMTAFDAEAKQHGWKKCFRCSTWIEKVDGTCDHMMCTVCHATFCYTCGKRWKTCRCDGMPPHQMMRPPTVNLRNPENRFPRHFRFHYPFYDNMGDFRTILPKPTRPSREDTIDGSVPGSAATVSRNTRKAQRDQLVLATRARTGDKVEKILSTPTRDNSRYNLMDDPGDQAVGIPAIPSKLLKPTTEQQKRLQIRDTLMANYDVKKPKYEFPTPSGWEEKDSTLDAPEEITETKYEFPTPSGWEEKDSTLDTPEEFTEKENVDPHLLDEQRLPSPDRKRAALSPEILQDLPISPQNSDGSTPTTPEGYIPSSPSTSSLKVATSPHDSEEESPVQETAQLSPQETSRLSPQITTRLSPQEIDQLPLQVTAQLPPQITTQLLPQIITQLPSQEAAQILPQETTQLPPQETAQLPPQPPLSPLLHLLARTLYLITSIFIALSVWALIVLCLALIISHGNLKLFLGMT